MKTPLEQFNALEIPNAVERRVADERGRETDRRLFFRSVTESLLGHFAAEEFLHQRTTELARTQPDMSRPEMLYELWLNETQALAFVHEKPVSYTRILVSFGKYSLEAAALSEITGYTQAEDLIDRVIS